MDETPYFVDALREWWTKNFTGEKNKAKNIRILLVAVFLATLIVLVVFNVLANHSSWLEREDPGHLTVLVADTVFNTLIIGLCFTLLDKLGLLRPIESEAVQLLDETKVVQEKFVSELEALATTSRAAFAEASDYARFVAAKHTFGLAGIRGLRESASQDRSYTVLVEALRAANATTIIYCMNTFLEHTEDLRTDIVQAVTKGAHLKFLLLDPADQVTAEARFRDAYIHEPSALDYEDNEDFSTMLRRLGLRFCRWREYANEQAHLQNSSGRMELRFYSGSINYPIVAIATKNGDVVELDRVFTGFYGGYSSEVMPYIEWENSKYPINRKLMAIFDYKWKEFEECTMPHAR